MNLIQSEMERYLSVLREADELLLEDGRIADLMTYVVEISVIDALQRRLQRPLQSMGPDVAAHLARGLASDALSMCQRDPDTRCIALALGSAIKKLRSAALRTQEAAD